MSTEAKEETKVEGKKAGDDAPPVNIGWDSHKAVVSIDFPSTLSQNDMLCISVVSSTKMETKILIPTDRPTQFIFLYTIYFDFFS